MSVGLGKPVSKQVEDSVDPTIQVSVPISWTSPTEAIVACWATLIASDDRRLSEATIGRFPGDFAQFRFGQLPSGPGYQSENQTNPATFYFGLSDRAVSHVETLRQRSPDKEARFKMDVHVASMRTAYRAERIGGSLPVPWNVLFQQTKAPTVSQPHRATVGEEGIIHMVPHDPDGVITLNVISRHPTTFEIPAVDWIKNYAPALNLGKWISFEIPIVEVEGSSSPLGPKLVRALEVLKGMKGDLLRGDWTQCVKDSRGVLEVFDDVQAIRSLLEADGYSPEAARALTDAVQNLHGLSSRYLKQLSKDAPGGSRALNPVLKAEEEDAYVSFLNSVAIVNLIAKKLRRASPPS